MLNSPQLGKGALRREVAFTGLEPRAHHPKQNKRHETNAGVGSDSVRQSVVHRPDLDLRLEHPKAPLNIGQRLVAANDVLGAQIGCIGHQRQFAIHKARMAQGVVIYRVP